MEGWPVLAVALSVNLLVAMTAFTEKSSLIVRDILPFIAIMIAGLLALSFVPEISLFLLQ